MEQETIDELREHWSLIVRTVFLAEDKIKGDLMDMLSQDGSNEEKARKYCNMIAEEILTARVVNMAGNTCRNKE